MFFKRDFRFIDGLNHLMILIFCKNLFHSKLKLKGISHVFLGSKVFDFFLRLIFFDNDFFDYLEFQKLIFLFYLGFKNSLNKINVYVTKSRLKIVLSSF